MVILGIDPGYAITGFGLVDYNCNRLRVIDFGVISTKANTPFPERLLQIANKIDQLITLHQPATMAIEELFSAVTRRPRSARPRRVEWQY